MSGFALVRTIPVQNTLGECILWDDETQSVWWTDIHESLLYRYRYASASLETFACPERLCSFGFVAGDSRLVCAFASGFALFDPVSGDLQWLYRPELQYRGTRFNDGRVDRQGRFWAGTMVEGDGRDAQGRAVKGSLYRISGSEQRRVFGGISVSNSLCCSPDGAVLYFADSPERRILAYGLDRGSGEPGEARIFAMVAGEGAPDGSTVDAEGYLWNAQWGGSKVVRYTSAGEVDRVLDLPVSQPTCVSFGGEDLDLLFVSTARENLSGEQIGTEPEAGNVLVYETGFRGLPESRFRG